MKRNKYIWLAVALLAVYMVPVTQLALHPYPPAVAPNGQKIVWQVNPATKKAEPVLEACPAPIQVWGSWFGWLNNWFFGTSPRCTGGGFSGGGGGAF